MDSKLLLRSTWLLASFTLFFQQKTIACGYAYVSDCATTIDIEKNGNTSTFQVSNCPYLTVFQNYNFGSVTSLSITKAVSQTWESCDNNVMNARLYYRIYLQSGTPGAFTSVNLPQLSTITNGAYRNKTRSGTPGINILAGLNAGNYFIEVYLESDVDFDNNGTPNIQIKKDNNGSYYKASFTIPSGQGGSLTVALASKTNVSCNGGNNGSATVNTTNGTAPFTYAWSNGATGATVSNLAAGSYSVTSTDSQGSTGTLNVLITQPAAILANLSSTNETSASANNGTATVAPTGGTPPYSISWSNGATTAAITNLDSGTYGVTVTGSGGCTATSSVTIIVSGTVPTNYCASKGDFPWVDWITHVKLNTIDKTSDKSDYSNFTTTSTELNTGTSYTITLENGFSWQTFDEYWKVWIDYNRNGTFEEPGEIAYSGILTAPPLGAPGGSKTGTITVPTTADEGTTRMRVSIKRGAYATPCETIPFGEVEDYTINLVNGGPVTCSITSSVSNKQCNDNGTNTNPNDDTFTFALTVNGNGTGASWSATIDGTAYTGNYGVAKTIGPLPISGGPVSYTVTDATDPACTASGSVTPPAPCSSTNPCAINATTSTPICNDNGTPTNPADDTYTFNLTVTGTNTGTGWTAIILGSSQSGVYGTAKLMGPYPISAGALNFSVKDAGDANCTKAVSVTPPAACSNGGGGTTYCAATSAFPWHDWVAGVTLTNVTNPSGKDAYSNFTSLTANVTAGSSYSLALTAGYSWFTYEEHWKVWIDYNHDGIFQEPGEVAYSFTQAAPPNGTLEATATGTINIPATALTGPTRMRVIMKRDADPTPCETIPNGEVEDYTVNIGGQFGNGTEERALALQLDAVTNLESIDIYGVVETTPDAAAWRLEKSGDGISFGLFREGSLAEEAHYFVVDERDETPFEGDNIYRLTLFDWAGNVLSKTDAAAAFRPVADFTLFPNPAVGEFYVEMSKLAGQNVTIVIYNQIGLPVYKAFIPDAAETNHLIHADGWQAGMYFVELMPEGRRPLTRRIMIGR
ncbi:MAG: GEVED domain-containing protein [Saprospiraceae bacterium]